VRSAGAHNSAHIRGPAAGANSHGFNDIGPDSAIRRSNGHRPCLTDPLTADKRTTRVLFTEGGYMLWVLAILMGGLSFGYVTVRRKRKGTAKRA